MCEELIIGQVQIFDVDLFQFLGATKHLYNWLCSLVGRSVGRVTHSFDDPHVAPYWPTWPCLRCIE